MGVAIRRAGPAEAWGEIRALVTQAFAFMEGRIDPPSSIHRWIDASCAAAASQGTCFLAEGPALPAEGPASPAEGPVLIGCLFAKPDGSALHLSKIAVAEAARRRGVAHALIAAAEREAQRRGLTALTLQSRVELTETHAAFAALGFSVVGRTAHPGYDTPTSLTLSKPIGDRG
ncbi:MAG: GNAT family N-acetyltransferase [Pseudomonadota bacterium]